MTSQEVGYVRGLLAEQAEVSKHVVALEEERLQKSLEHMEAMVELEKEMSFLGELYPSVASTADDDTGGGRATQAKRIKGNGELFHDFISASFALRGKIVHSPKKQFCFSHVKWPSVQ